MNMDDTIEIRSAQYDELTAVLNMVGAIVNETYGHLFNADTPVPINPKPWKHCRISTVDDRIVGVVLASGDHVDDLWLLKQYRGRHIGSRLLASAETQISDAGFSVGKLRVVAENEPACHFYEARGWAKVRCYQHEVFGFEMVDMEKSFSD